MLGKLLSPLTTATATGVATRDIVMVIGAMLTMLGVLGFLSKDQVDELTRQLPLIIPALGTIAMFGVSIYRIFTKSSSDKAAEVAKVVDAEVPKSAPVVIKTPEGVDDIVVPMPKGR